jgi:ribosome-associated heat shock protein Hsp15
MPDETQVRTDKWLWAVRVFKTRSVAAEACRLGRVTIDGTAAKASRIVKVGDVMQVRKDGMTLTYKVLGLLGQRVSAAAAKAHAEDQTPEAERQRAREIRLAPVFHRPRGAGRPTKKERRALNDILGPS